ncbi:MAG: DNA gyrase inhibitor YacG [SAR324 cluster bacterium]
MKCPQCGKPARWEGNPDRPFCSERCRLIDLGQWADGGYAIPAEKVPDKDDEE